MQKFILERISTEVHQAIEKCQSWDNSLLSTCVFVLDSVSDGDDDDDQAAHWYLIKRNLRFKLMLWPFKLIMPIRIFI